MINSPIPIITVEVEVLKKIPLKYQKMVTWAEHDRYGMYVIAIEHPTFGKATFVDSSFSNLMWELRQFCKDGSRF